MNCQGKERSVFHRAVYIPPVLTKALFNLLFMRQAKKSSPARGKTNTPNCAIAWLKRGGLAKAMSRIGGQVLVVLATSGHAR